MRGKPGPNKGHCPICVKKAFTHIDKISIKRYGACYTCALKIRSAIQSPNPEAESEGVTK